MALVACGECGKEVSDKAASCPGCGAPIASTADSMTSKQESSDPYEDVSVKEILMRDRSFIEGYVTGRKLFKYLPVVVMIIILGFYLPFRIASERGVEYEQYAFMSVGAIVLGVVFRKRLNGWAGWIAAVVMIAAVFLFPESVSREDKELAEMHKLLGNSGLAAAARAAAAAEPMLARYERIRTGKETGGNISASDAVILRTRIQEFVELFESSSDEMAAKYCAPNGYLSWKAKDIAVFKKVCGPYTDP